MSSSARKKCDGCEAYLEPNDFHVHGEGTLSWLAEIQSLKAENAKLREDLRYHEEVCCAEVDGLRASVESLTKQLAEMAESETKAVGERDKLQEEIRNLNRRKLESDEMVGRALRQLEAANLQVDVLKGALKTIASIEPGLTAFGRAAWIAVGTLKELEAASVTETPKAEVCGTWVVGVGPCCATLPCVHHPRQAEKPVCEVFVPIIGAKCSQPLPCRDHAEKRVEVVLNCACPCHEEIKKLGHGFPCGVDECAPCARE